MRRICTKVVMIISLLLILTSTLSLPTIFADIDFGNKTPGGAGNSIKDNILGSKFVAPGVSGQLEVQSITAYIACNGHDYHMKAAIYDDSYNLVGETDEQIVPNNNYVPTWVTFSFSTKPTIDAGQTYLLVAWSEELGTGSADLYYIGAGPEFFWDPETYNDFPDPGSFVLYFAKDNGQFKRACIYATVDPLPGFVIPEFPLGTITALAAMMLAFVGMVVYSKKRATVQPI